jgi:hypothetical protein
MYSLAILSSVNLSSARPRWQRPMPSVTAATIAHLAQTADGLRADLVGLGVRLGWVTADEKEEPALSVIRERLRHEGEGILLIYDNALDAEALKPCLPPGGAARVLVTSNAHAWRGVAEPVEIRLWPKEIGADYLVARTGRAVERPGAKALSQALGGLPLAHEQAAAYCERLEVPLAEYLRRFESAPGRMLDTARDAPAEYHDRLTVAKTFALAIAEAASLHPGAETLIVHAARRCCLIHLKNSCRAYKPDTVCRFHAETASIEAVFRSWRPSHGRRLADDLSELVVNQTNARS